MSISGKNGADFFWVSHCRSQEKKKVMAREIKETPVITGEDARRFREAMENLQPISKERKEEQRKAYEWFKSRAKFPVI
jgi:hypothetical protein